MISIIVQHNKEIPSLYNFPTRPIPYTSPPIHLRSSQKAVLPIPGKPDPHYYLFSVTNLLGWDFSFPCVSVIQSRGRYRPDRPNQKYT